MGVLVAAHVQAAMKSAPGHQPPASRRTHQPGSKVAGTSRTLLSKQQLPRRTTETPKLFCSYCPLVERLLLLIFENRGRIEVPVSIEQD